MPTGYQIKNQDYPHFLTLQIVEWVDIFTRQVYRNIIVDALNFCINQKQLIVYGYVIMSNHVHLIAQSSNNNLSATIRDFKSFTSKEMLKYIETGIESRDEWMLNIFKKAALKHKRNSNYQVWTHENHALEVHSYQFFRSKLDYLHANPIRAGIVKNAEDYLYSSATNYAGENGLVQVEIATLPWKTIS
ncbi:MAG: REP-associated tyrosine transposase [Bacteroidia bacterium]